MITIEDSEFSNNGIGILHSANANITIKTTKFNANGVAIEERDGWQTQFYRDLFLSEKTDPKLLAEFLQLMQALPTEARADEIKRGGWLFKLRVGAESVTQFASSALAICDSAHLQSWIEKLLQG